MSLLALLLALGAALVWWNVLVDHLDVGGSGEVCVPQGPDGQAVIGITILANSTPGTITVHRVDLRGETGLVLTRPVVAPTAVYGGGFVGTDVDQVPDLPLPATIEPGEDATLFLTLWAPPEGGRADGITVTYSDRWGRSATVDNELELVLRLAPAGARCF